MTGIAITLSDPRSADATALISASHSLMQSLFPAEACHYLSIDDLCQPDIHVYVAYINSKPAGCGALMIRESYGEVKSMYTDDTYRGQGVADRILKHIEKVARQRDMPVLRLETGDTLTAAHRLYARHGFVTCAPFGDYYAHPKSLFMEKTL